MGDNSLLVKKNVQEFTEFIEAIPYLKNDNYKLKNITYKNTKEYTQALLNSLISKSYIKNIYSIFDNKINLKNIKYYVRNHDINLLINLRYIYFDNTFRYVAGYIPQETQAEKYYLYSQLSPANQYKEENDYLFFSVDYYKDYFIPCELSTLRKHLIAIPIFLKHFYKIKNYLYDIAEIKKVLISDLEKNNCNKYIQLISDLDETNTFDYKYIDRENQEDYFHILFAYHFQRSLQVKTLNIDAKTRSNMFYLMLVNKNIDTLPLGLPDIVKYDNFEFNNNDNKNYNLTTYMPSYTRPTDPPPPPPLPKFNPICKYDPKADFKPETVLTLSKEKLNEFMNKNMQNKNVSYIDELKSKISKFKKFVGGEQQITSDNKIVTFDTPENKDMYANVSHLDNISDYIVEQNNYKLPTVSSINRNPNINSIEKTSNLFFTNLSGFERFSQSNFFKKKINLIYEFLKQDKELGLITFEFNSFYFNIFIISHKVDDLGLLHLFNNYFSIIKEYLIYINTNSDSIFFLKDNFVQLGAIVLKLLDIFSIYTINKVVPFRHYMKNYYQTLRLINNSMASSVSLYSTLLNLLQSFKKNIMEPLIGGNHTSIKMFDVNKYETLYFYDYVYLLDGVTHLQYHNTEKSDYYKCTIDDDVPNNEIYKFFDGIEFNKFIKMSPNQQYVLSTVNKTMFLTNLKEGTKMLFKKRDSFNDNTRICFIIRQLTDKYNAYDLIKELSNIIKSDYVSIQNLEEFLYKFNLIIDNVKLNDLLKRLNKIETSIEAPMLLNYYKSIKNEDSTEKNTLIELFLFLFYFLVKIGFDVSHFMSKSSIVINVTPELSKKNILQYFEENKELSKISKEILKDNEDLFDFLINSSIKINIDRGDGTGGSKFVFKLPQDNNILENNISDNVLNLYNNNVDSDILTTNFDNIFEKETQEFQDNLDILISTDNMNLQNLYKIIPNYIITQSTLVDNFDILSNKKNISGGSSENHPIKIFLEKYTNTSGTAPGSIPIPKEFVEKNIDMILQEQYFKTLDKLVLFYDNKLLADHKYNTNSTIIRNIINSMEYMRKYYKVDFENNIKLGIVTLINNIQNTDEIIYQTFVVIQYIKHFIIYMYKKLGINFDEYNISINDFSVFYKIIEPRFIDRAKYMKTIYDINIKNSFDKLNLPSNLNQSLYENINIDDIKTEIFNVNTENNSMQKNQVSAAASQTPSPTTPAPTTPAPTTPAPTTPPPAQTPSQTPSQTPAQTPAPPAQTPSQTPSQTPAQTPAPPAQTPSQTPSQTPAQTPTISNPSQLTPPQQPASRGAGVFEQLNNMVVDEIQNL